MHDDRSSTTPHTDAPELTCARCAELEAALKLAQGRARLLARAVRLGLSIMVRALRQTEL